MTSNYKIIGLMLAMFSLAACSEAELEEPNLRPVRSMKIDLGSYTSARSFSGTAQTDKVVNLSFRSSGVITAFNIELGLEVEKGMLLAELDNVAARLGYEQAIAARNSSESEMDTKNLNRTRVQTLYEKGGASLSDYENAKNASRTSSASFQSAQRSVEIQEEQIRYGKIYAPEKGVIASVSSDIDENVSSGQTVAVLNVGSDIEIELGLPERVINLVKQSALVPISFAALPGKMFNGQVSEISPSIDSQTATYPVRIKVLNASDQIRPGMAANVDFDFSDDSSLVEEILVPATSVGEDSNGRFVFTLEAQAKTEMAADTDVEPAMPAENVAVVRKRVVVIGELVGSQFVIKSGLKSGDHIVTAGVHSVIDGQRVLVP